MVQSLSAIIAKAELDDTQAYVEDELYPICHTACHRIFGRRFRACELERDSLVKGYQRGTLSFHISSSSTPNVIANCQRDLCQQW